MRAFYRVAIIGLAQVLLATACASPIMVDQAADSATPTTILAPTILSIAAPTPTPADAAASAASQVPVPPPSAPSQVPMAPPSAPSQVPVPPTSAPSPTPTPTPVDTTPVVIQGDGWVTTEADVARLATFVEETHQLEYTEPVTVLVSDDIGAEYAPNFEAFESGEWWLLQALGFAQSQVDRDVTNQVRRDRIRGLCCRFNDGTQVVVEVEATKLETEAIVVHELTHALHTQYPDLFENTRYDTDETPKPFAASIEGVPQFVMFAYLDRSSAEELAAVAPELPIIGPDMVPLIGPGPALHLNFAYATGPAFVKAVVDARGIEGLTDLLASPPTTTEQILFPDKYLAGETAVDVPAPAAAPGDTVVASGTIGAAMLMFVLVNEHGESAALELVESWAGDRYVVYEVDENVCMLATIALDTAEAQLVFGAKLIDSFRPALPDVTVTILDAGIELRTCGDA